MPKRTDIAKILIIVARRSFLLAAALFLLGLARAHACVEVSQQYTVYRDFVVEVKKEGKRAAGIEVRITGSDTPATTTDENGIASFHGVKPGTYSIITSYAGVDGEDAELRVVDGNTGAYNNIDLRWPDRRIFEVQRVAGKMSSYTFRETGQDLGDLLLSLTNTSDSHLLATTITNQHGEFEFKDVPLGLYVLHVSRQTIDKKSDINGDVLVEVMSDVDLQRLPHLGLAMTDCGLLSVPLEDKYVPLRNDHSNNAQTY